MKAQVREMTMRKAACLIVAIAITLLNSGCANGPLAKYLRGGECSSCSAMPVPSETYPGAYSMETSGTCGVNGCTTCGGGQGNVGQTLNGFSGNSTMGIPMEGQFGADLNGGLPIGNGGVYGSGGFSASPTPGPSGQ